MIRTNRREFMQQVGAGLAALAYRGRREPASPAYVVGIGRRPDPYLATLAAISGCGQWPSSALSGRTVVIKPNLAIGSPATSGITTDPEVVRAVVDLALAEGAAQVLIAEGGPWGAALFADCGYGFFDSYDAQGRVRLLDLNLVAESLVPVPEGMAYGNLYLPEAVLAEDVFFVSAGKMKTHFHTVASLAMKNLLGLPLLSRYGIRGSTVRAGMHERGIHQAIVDLNRVRPVHFAVIDGIWAMEGKGPTQGTAVSMDTVVAGANAPAVDRVCLQAMGIAQGMVHHLNLAARLGMGPADLSDIEVAGDPLISRSFVLPETPPIVSMPWIHPRVFSPETGQSTNILYWLGPPGGLCSIRIALASPDAAALTPIRTVQAWTGMSSGVHFARWDGLDDSGRPVPGPGTYAVQLRAMRDLAHRQEMDAVSWVTVR
ncbi:MAG: DUF362 domain-containing protein [bacterium]